MGSGSSTSKARSADDKTNNSGSQQGNGSNTLSPTAGQTVDKHVPPVGEKRPTAKQAQAVETDSRQSKEAGNNEESHGVTLDGKTGQRIDESEVSTGSVGQTTSDANGLVEQTNREGAAGQMTGGEANKLAGQTMGGAIVEDVLIDEGPKDQLKFDSAVKSACLLVIIRVLPPNFGMWL